MLWLAAGLAASTAWGDGPLAVNTPSVNLTGAVTTAAVTVTGQPFPITFLTAVSCADSSVPASSCWLSANPASNITPATVYLQVTQPPSPASGAGPFTATVTFTGGGGAATLQVTFTPGAGAGPAGAVTVLPASLVLRSLLAGSAQGTLTLRGPTSPAAFTVSTSAGAGWSLASDTTGGTVDSNTPVTLSITAATANSAAATYSGMVVITPAVGAPLLVPVKFEVGGSGSGIALAGGGPTPNNLNLAIPYSSSGALPPDIAIAVQGASVSMAYEIQDITTSDGAAWLMANLNATGNPFYAFSLDQPLIVDLSPAASKLAAGSYTGIITLASVPDLANSATVTVTLTVDGAGSGVTVDPAGWTPSAAAGGAPESQTFGVAAADGVLLGQVTADQPWLQVSPIGPVGTFIATADPSGLAAYVYQGNILIRSSYAGTLSQTVIPVAFTVSQGGGTGTPIVAPTSLNFAFQAGGASPIPPQTIAIPEAAASYTAKADQPWIALDPPAAGSAGATVRVSAAGLTPRAAPYTGNINVTTPSGQAAVAVSLLITNSPVLVSNPGSLYFPQTALTLGPRTVDLAASDGTAVNIAAGASANAPWLQVTSAPGSTGGVEWTVSVDATALSPGLNSGSIQVMADGMANSPMTYPVVANGGVDPAGGLTLSSTALKFSALVGGAPPAPWTLTVDSVPGAASFTATAAADNGLNWLSISPAGLLTARRDISVAVNQAGLAAGTYNGAITLTRNGVALTVGVTLVVTPTVSSGDVTLDKTALTFTYQVGAALPPAQAVQVSNSVPETASIRYSAATAGGSWLKVTPTSSATQTSVSVSVDPAGLSVNSYNGLVTITPSGGRPVQVPVLFIVATPVISVDATALTFTYHPGDARPAPRAVSVSSGPAASFTASADSDGGWLSVTPAAGSGSPATVTVSVDPTIMAPNTTYHGRVTVSGSNGTSGSATILVTVNVLPPYPTITKLGNAASLYGGSVAPGEILSIFGTNLGPTTPAGPAFDAAGNIAAATGGVQVFFSGYPAPVTLAGGTQVNAVVPYEVAGLDSVNVWVKFLNQTSNSVTVPVSASVPGVFTADRSGTGPGAILNADMSANSPVNPAPKGGDVVVYITGEGSTLPSGVSGKVTAAQPAQPYTPGPALPVAVLIDGRPVAVTFAGEAPGFVSGLMQVSVKILPDARSGNLPIVVSVGGNASQSDPLNPVTVSVR